MADMFGRAADAYGGAFSADAARITFASDPGLPPPGLLGTTAGGLNPPFDVLETINGGVGMLTQQLSFNYQQQISRIYEIGTNLSFYVAGRTQGNMSIGRVIGPRPVAVAFYRKYGSVCDAATNHLDIEMATGCRTTGGYNQPYSFAMKFCVIMSIGVSVQAQDMMINEQLQVMFASLGMKGVRGG